MENWYVTKIADQMEAQARTFYQESMQKMALDGEVAATLWSDALGSYNHKLKGFFST